MSFRKVTNVMYGDLHYLQGSKLITKLLYVVGFVLLYPLLLFAYWLAPCSKVSFCCCCFLNLHTIFKNCEGIFKTSVQKSWSAVIISTLTCEKVVFTGSSGVLLGHVQGLSVPFARVGSGDPVRVLRLYTTNTLDTLWSIYCWDICTTCRYQTYVLCYGWMCPGRVLTMNWTATLHGVVSFIVTCVDVGRTVFRDHSYGYY